MGHRIYFYIPGAESLQILYFLASKHGDNLVVITPSLSVKEVCVVIGVESINADFHSSSVSSASINAKWVKRCKPVDHLSGIIYQLADLISCCIVIIRAKSMVKTMPHGCILYYSTYYFDVSGMIFLREALRSRKIYTKFMWPSEIRFNKTSRPPIMSRAFILNRMTSNLFAFHQHPIVGRGVGVNPRFLSENNAEFVYNVELKRHILPKKFKFKAISSLNLEFKNKSRVLFLGEYSVEEGVSTYGDVYLRLLKLMSELKGVDVFYKPHPLYHSINHDALKGISILDTQLPVELLDDGSWTFIVGFLTAALITKKVSKCISLIKIKELGTVPFNYNESLKWLNGSVNEIIYPTSMLSFERLLNTDQHCPSTPVSLP